MKMVRTLALRSMIVATTAAVLATLALAAPAQASELPAGSDSGDMFDASVPADVAQLPNGDLHVTQPSTGFSMTMTRAEIDRAAAEIEQALTEAEGQGITPDSGHHLVTCYGTTWSGPYFCLSRLAQQMLIGGSVAAVASALCVIGPVTCVAASSILAAVGIYLIQVGPCRGSLRVELSWSLKIRNVRCL